MFNLKKALVALIAVLTLHGVEARADSFEITNVQGMVYITTSIDAGPPILRLGPTYGLRGPGLVVFTQLNHSGDPGNVEARDTCIQTPCTPGQVIGTNSSFSGLISSAFFTSARVNGVNYDRVRVTGSLNFVSQPIVLPNVGSSMPTVTIPFTFSGELTGDALQPDVVNPAFTAKLSGQGLATFYFEQLIGSDLQNPPRYRLSSIYYQFGPPIPISIDIKPATFPNSINPKSNGKIPVAILTTDSFDATAVDPTTVLFGATGNEVAPVQSATQDVDGDGDTDMVLHFVTQDTGITCGHTSASLTGALYSGVRIKSSDSIDTVGCNQEGRRAILVMPAQKLLPSPTERQALPRFV